MLHWYINPKMINGSELNIPGKSSLALWAPTLKPSLIEGLVPCSRMASKKIVRTMKKETITEMKAVKRKAVSLRGSDIGNVKHWPKVS